jgi:peptide/nickel transport system permease protein
MRERVAELWRGLGRAPGARAALVVVTLLLLIAVCAPIVVPYGPNESLDLLGLKNQAPSWSHPFGTDPFSRDVLSRVIAGSRVSLFIALTSVAMATVMGAAVGALAGLRGGWTDAICMRLVDAAMSVPRVLLVVTVVALWRTSSTGVLVLLLGGTGWFGLARLVRGEVRALATRDFATAAQALGISPWRRATHHFAPHLVPLLIAHGTLSVATVIAVEAALSYLGLGVRPPTPSWGNIMLEGSGQVGQFWWLTLFPALATILTVAALHTLGDGLRTTFSSPQLGPVASTDAAS